MLCNRDTRRIAAKELTLFFSSPMAYLFMGVFVAVMFYLFFWVETFFARNIADVRPLFQWMPIMMIFLASALTMRMWSEEHRSGTIEYVMTVPVKVSHFVMGKFYACLTMLILSLVLTLSLPVMVAMIADLDWGPVLAGYLASILLGAAYLSIGLYISARSDSQIVSLLLTALVCSLFNLVGSPLFTDFFGHTAADWLRLIGSGARFESIERGVIDARDLYYYLTVTIVFLVMNVYALEKRRWASAGNKKHQRNIRIGSLLLLLNIMLVNVWLWPQTQLRLDTTKGQVYSLSEASKSYLSRLNEPLLLRGYFSGRTHPLLSPLVPKLRDILKEYEVAGGGKIKVEFIDPQQSPVHEEEANKKYGIKPVPLQVTDKYQASLVNSYFNILVKYGNEYEVLGFRDLIEIKASSETDIDVQLRNPEYDITRSVKKVLLSYQSGGNLFSQIQGDINLTAYISADDKLPEILRKLKSDLFVLFRKFTDQSNGKLKIKFLEPESNNGAVAAEMKEKFGFKPMVASLADTRQFFFYVVLESNGQHINVPLPDGYTVDGFEKGMQAGIRRFTKGFIKTVGIVAPVLDPYMAQLARGNNQFKELKKALEENYRVSDVDLRHGVVPAEIDILLLLAPADMADVELFAVDQFLMQGGTVVAATSPFVAQVSNNKLHAGKIRSGLEGWLASHGISIQSSMIMDPDNAAFPVPITRSVGGFSFQELRMLDYPYFADIRDGLNQESAITASLGQLTVPWASPIEIDQELNSKRQSTVLISSSSQAWASTSLDVMPRIRADGKSPFPPGEDQGQKVAGMILEGKFDSYYKNKPSPLLSLAQEKASGQAGEQAKQKTGQEKKQQNVIASVIESSPSSARLVLFSSNELLEDQTVRLLSSAQGTLYANTYQLLANVLDWSLEDRLLLQIRSRSHFGKTLPSLERSAQSRWEYINYIAALLGIILIAGYRKVLKLRKIKSYKSALKEAPADA